MSDGRYWLQTPEQTLIPVICKRKRQKIYWGKRSGCLVRIRRRVANLPLPSVLLVNVQSLDNKLYELKSRIFYQRDTKNCNILCFTESWLNDDMNNMAGYTLYRLDRTATSGLCIFVNNSWCTISKDVSRFCSPEVGYLMISCRPQYLPSEFSSVFFVAVYIYILYIYYFLLLQLLHFTFLGC